MKAAKQALKASTKVPAAVKAKPDALEDETTALVVMPKSTALSLDVGIEALRDYYAAEADDDQITQLRESNKNRRGRAQVSLAIAFYRAALADKSIVLADSLLPAKGNKPIKDKLGAQLKLVVGLSEIRGKRIVPTEDARMLTTAMPGDDEATIKRKNSVRVNFAALITKAAQVALHAIENGAKLELDKETGMARLTDGKAGNAVKSQFGVASVLLNEDQNVKVADKKGNVKDVKLKALPSFTEIQRKVAADHGKAVVNRKVIHAAVDPIKDMIARCGHMVTAIEKLPAEIPEELNKALVALHSAIDSRIA